MRQAQPIDRTSRPSALPTFQRGTGRQARTRSEAGAILQDLSGPSAAQWAEQDVFTAAVHELKTPLAAISGQIQLARKLMAKDPARVKAAMDLGLQQVERMSKLIGGLQDHLRLQSKALSLEVVTFDLCEAVENAISRHEYEETARFRLDRPKDGVQVRGDPDRIAQILDNLLDNALKYSPAGAPIDVAVTTILGEAQVRVEDYGIGVAAEERDRMFGAYYRTSRTSGIPGSGLGLYISRRLAEEQGGRLWLDDSTDAGSIFAFTLPSTASAQR